MGLPAEESAPSLGWPMAYALSWIMKSRSALSPRTVGSPGGQRFPTNGEMNVSRFRDTGI